MWNLKFSLFDFKTSGFLISCKVTSYEGEEDINLLPIEGFVACGRQRAVIFLQRPSKFAMVRGTWSGEGYAFSLGRIFSSLSVLPSIAPDLFHEAFLGQ